jgi:hypothetical protein
MATEQERADLWVMLRDKRVALTQWEHAFNLSVPVNERPNYEGFLISVQAEKEQVSADMDALLGEAPVPFPSPEAIQALQASTGALAQVTATSNDVNELLQVATTALNSWPFV